MPIISNPAGGAGFGRNQFMDMPIQERGASWFDDFDRLDPNINNAGWEYRTRWTDPEIEFGINAGKYLYLKDIGGSGTPAETGVLSEAGLWKNPYGQSPYKKPNGIKLRLDGVKATNNGSRGAIGFCNLDRATAAGMTNCVTFNLTTNIVGFQYYVATVNNGGTADTNDIGNAGSNSEVNLTITIPADRYPVFTFQNAMGGACLLYTSPSPRD